MFRALFLLLMLSACATGPSRSDVALQNVHDLEARLDAYDVQVESAITRYETARDACHEQSCQQSVEDLRQHAIILFYTKQAMEKQVERAQRDLDYAEAAEDRASARRAAASSALIGMGAGLLSQPRPVICNTSDTTNPTTVCQ